MNRGESLHQKTWRGLDPLNFPFDECAEVPAELALYPFRLLLKGRTLNCIEPYTVYIHTVILTLIIRLIET